MIGNLRFLLQCFLSVLYINDVATFWEIRTRILKGSKFALLLNLIAKIIRKHYACAIPISEKIQPFSTPHGFYGIFISQYASVESNCIILQNVTIGSTNIRGGDGESPCIGNNCLIGAGAIIVGKVKIGNNAKIGAGAVVARDIPENGTAVMQVPRIIQK